MWLVDEFGIRKDPSYAHENGKPVVFVWDMHAAGSEHLRGDRQQGREFFKE